MARTLLELVQTACYEIGIPAPQFLFSSTNDQELQLLALANREGKDFSCMANKNGGWQKLRTDYTFSTVIGEDTYDLPADLEYFVEKTFWDNQYKWSLLPISAQEKQILRYGVGAGSIRSKFYIQDNKMVLNPVPTSVQTIAFDYYSNYWALNTDGVTTQPRFLADSDTYLLDEDCFIQGIKWRYLRSKGLDYSEEFKAYQDDCQRVISRDGGQRDLPIGGSDFGTHLLNGGNVPETGYGD